MMKRKARKNYFCLILVDFVGEDEIKKQIGKTQPSTGCLNLNGFESFCFLPILPKEIFQHVKLIDLALSGNALTHGFLR